jgi:hypothetical protein
MIKIFRCIFLFFLILFFQSCADEYTSIEKFVITPSNHTLKADTIITDEVGGLRFSRLRKVGQAGYSAVTNLSIENRDKKIWVIFSGKVRTNYAHSNATISIAAVGLNQEIVVWNATFLKYFITDINKWCPFKDSVLLPREKLNQKYSVINTMAYLGNSESENFDIDTLRVEYKAEVRK